MEEIRTRLQTYLREPVRDVKPSPDGHSGFTYYVSTDTKEYVLRLPPPGARIAGPADVVRQGRIMAALHVAGLPVPNIVAMVEEPSVLDGRPFILMERVEGQRIEQIAGSRGSHDIAQTAIDALKRLHQLPLGQTGIGDEAPSSLSDEIERWTWLIQRAPVELTGGAPELARRLRATIPRGRQATLVHADYHYGNLLFAGDGTVSAILDWEIAEIGDPLVDLGALYVVSQRYVEVDMRELARLYGVAFGEARWYFALGLYKYAAIYGYNTMLHRRGKRPDTMYDELVPVIPRLLEEGMELLV